MKILTKTQLEHRLNNNVKEHIKNRINERIEVHIKNFQNKIRTKNAKNASNLQTIDQERYNNLQHHVFNNNTKFETHSQYYTYNTKIEDLEEFKDSSDYEALWEIAIDKWTRNWNFYREKKTDSIPEKFGMNNKRQKNKQK